MFTGSANPPVFADEKGRPCKFFVEAAAVRERPALIRKILKNGGSIVNTVLDADILLAEVNTKEALELFEAWWGDRLLLSTRWIAHCLEANTFLGGDRGWGGCELTWEILRQGIADKDTSDTEEVQEIRKPARSCRTVSSFRAAKTSQSKQASFKPSPSRLTSSPSPNKPRHCSPKAKSTSDHGHPHISTNPHLSTAQSHPVDTPQGSQNSTWPPFQASPSPMALQQSLFASMFSSPFQSSQQPISPDMHVSGQYPNIGQMAPLPSSQQPISPDLYVPGQHPNFAPQMAPLIHPSLLQQLLAQHLMATQQHLNSQPTRLSDPSGLSGTGQQLIGINIPTSSTQGSLSRQTPEDVDPDLVSNAASTTSEEAEVELSISKSRTKKRVKSNSSSDREIQTAVRSNPPRPKEAIPKMKSGIFANEKGMSQMFYVMIDLKNRKDLLKIIRKNDGDIVSQVEAADYIILNIRSSQFQKILDILPVHKVALSPTWIEECEKANALVNVKPYVIDVASGVGRGVARRKPVVKPRHLTSEAFKSKADSSPLRGEGATSKRTLRKIALKEPPQEAMTSSRSRSPSPIPPTDVESVGDDKFTENDRAWFLTYARFKLERDPRMTNDALIQAVARKAPHHSVQSWVNAWRTMWPNEMRALKQGINAPVEQRVTALPSSSNPSTTGEIQNELIFPDFSTPPLSNQFSLDRPSNSASTWNSSQAESNSGIPLKRKERYNEAQVDNVALNQQNKRIKTSPDIVNVDAFPNP